MQEDDVSTANLVASAEQLSVRERMQRFNRLANETDSSPRSPANNTQTKKRSEKVNLKFHFNFFKLDLIFNT